MVGGRPETASFHLATPAGRCRRLARLPARREGRPWFPPTHARFQAISTCCPQLLMTVVAHRRPLGHTVQRKPPAPAPKACPARIAIRRQPTVFTALYALPSLVTLPPLDPREVCFDAGQPHRPSCPLRHTRGFVTSNSALPNCCTPANHSSVRPGTQRSLRDTHRALLGGFLVSRSFCSASAIS